jgi:hypothetical protein
VPTAAEAEAATQAEAEAAAQADAAIQAEAEAAAQADAAIQAEAEQALTTVTSEANGLTRVDPADSYVTAGGRVLRLPTVLAALYDLGWAGVSLDQLAGASPLRSLATRMTRSPQIGNAR